MGVESMGMNNILITAYSMTPFGCSFLHLILYLLGVKLFVVNMSKMAQFKVVVLEMQYYFHIKN